MKKSILDFLGFLCAFSVLLGAIFVMEWNSVFGGQQIVSVNSLLPTVVLDAGHGGEDGGAVSKTGALVEKNINLSITLYLKDLLEANGFQVRLTREDDRLLYDRTVDYHGRKKALDLAARRKIAEETENCVLVSIHLNAFPMEQYRGLQVWYSPNNEASLLLAEQVQSTVREGLQPENHRKIKPATSSIYLLHHATFPALLIECGFLTNEEEAALLGSEEYQQQLAFHIFSALNSGLRKISC